MAKTKAKETPAKQVSSKSKNGKSKKRGNMDHPRMQASMFKPGQSGNPTGIKGRTNNHPMKDEMERQLLENNGAELKEIVKAGIKFAKKGDFRYFEEFLQRIDGKIPSIARIGGDPGGVPISMGLAHLSVNELLKIVAATEPKENGS